MDVFIGNLPVPKGDSDADTLVTDLRAAFGVFARKVDVAVYVKQPAHGDEFCYAVVSGASRRLGTRLIQTLHHKPLGAGRLVVRVYRARAASNDRRAIDWRTRDWTAPERRAAERRCFQQSGAAGWQAERVARFAWSEPMAVWLKRFSWSKLISKRSGRR